MSRALPSCDAARSRATPGSAPRKKPRAVPVPWRGGRARGAGDPRGLVLRDARGRVVRFAERDELRAVSALQTRGFYEPALGPLGPLEPVDAPLRAFFAWDVLRTLRQKFEYARAGRFAPLVVTVDDANGDERIVGVCEVSVQRDFEVIEALREVKGLAAPEEYAYLSCMTVDDDFRRQQMASSLIRAGESVAKEWGFDIALLHVYEENRGAVRVYEKAGYKTLDAPFRTPYDVLRGQTKLLMAKRI
jgi:ribosomal protein S18 acetylase RimI-like enzyme